MWERARESAPEVRDHIQGIQGIQDPRYPSYARIGPCVCIGRRVARPFLRRVAWTRHQPQATRRKKVQAACRAHTSGEVGAARSSGRFRSVASVVVFESVRSLDTNLAPRTPRRSPWQSRDGHRVRIHETDKGTLLDCNGRLLAGCYKRAMSTTRSPFVRLPVSYRVRFGATNATHSSRGGRS